MYTFAIVALLALATIKVVDVLEDLFSGLDRYKGLFTLGVAVAGAFVLDYSMFGSWGVSVDDEAVAKVMTGFVVGGMTTPWRAIFGYLSSGKAEDDETLHRHEHIRRAA